MDVKTVCQAIGGTLLQGSGELRVDGCSIDTRSLQPGNLFFALTGEKRDGLQFVPEAFHKGAVAAVIPQQENLNVDGTLIAVEDPLAALQQLACYVRETVNFPVVAVTGSNGKTTTKDMIASVLSTAGRTLKSTGNYNNEIGLPLTLLGLEPTHKAAVLEMGMRGLGQISFLCRIARPTIGVITNIGTAHFELLGSRENIARAKGELLEYLPRDGFAVLNGDDPWCRELQSLYSGRVVFYGLDSPAEVRGEQVTYLQGRRGMEFTVRLGSQSRRVFLPVLGKQNARNALAAIAVGHTLGLGPDKIIAGLSNLDLSSMRLEITLCPGGVTLINDAYNANPSSMKMALEVLGEIQAKRKIAVLGDMLELGELELEAHREIGKEAVAAGLDILITVGERARQIAAEAVRNGLNKQFVQSFEKQEEARPLLVSLLKDGDALLVKGSRGMELDSLARFLLREQG